MAIQSDISWNIVGNVRNLVSCAFWTRLGGVNDSQIDPVCLWLRLSLRLVFCKSIAVITLTRLCGIPLMTIGVTNTEVTRNGDTDNGAAAHAMECT